ncbi:MAG: Cna B-type domain-containing protein [Candidatus Limivicinus sp.]
MNINAGARRLLISFVCVFMAFLLLAGSFPAQASQAEGTGEIPVVKRWQGEEPLPESVTVKLLERGSSIRTLRLTAADAQSDGSWQGSFRDIPLYDSQGRPIDYTVAEEPVTGYVSTVTQQPRAAALTVGSFGEKVTPASDSSYAIGSSRLVVANKGGHYYVWTLSSLGAAEKKQLLAGINAANLQGLGKELTENNTEFAAGLPVSFSDGVRLRKSGQVTYIEFEKTNVWSLFYAGDYSLREAQGAVILNRAEEASPTESPAPTASPAPTVTPAPTASPAPTEAPAPTEPPSPTEPPKTWDAGTGCAFAMMGAALLGLLLILGRLTRS